MVCLARAVCLLSTIAFNKMVINWSMTVANADGILTDFVIVEANWNAVQGVAACNIQKVLGHKTTLFYIRTLAIILEPTRCQSRWVFRRTSPIMRAAKQQAGRVLPVCDTVNKVISRVFRIHQYCNFVGTRFGTSLGSALGLYTFNNFVEAAARFI